MMTRNAADPRGKGSFRIERMPGVVQGKEALLHDLHLGIPGGTSLVRETTKNVTAVLQHEPIRSLIAVLGKPHAFCQRRFSDNERDGLRSHVIRRLAV